MAERYTVDELARASGLNTSTIRLYRQRGLLPPPQMEGRVGYFDEGHVARLKLIGELQERGFSLAAIKDLVESWESGRDLKAVLGMEQVLARPMPQQTMTLRELERRLPELQQTPALLDRLRALSAIADTDDGAIAVSAGFLDTYAALRAIGVPLDVMLDEFAPVWEFAQAQARRFIHLFERYVLVNVEQVDPTALAQVIEGLRTAGIGVVAAALGIAIDDAAADAVARHLPPPVS